MELTIHTLDTAPTESRPILEGIATDLGLVPNLAAAAAASPALLAGFDGLRRAVASTKLDPVLREVAGLAVGVAVDNRYGIAFHSTVLAGLGVDEADITAMRSGTAPADRAAAGVYRFARELALGAAPDPAGTGLGDEQVLEVVLECSFAALVGMVDRLAGHVELDGFLAARGQ